LSSGIKATPIPRVGNSGAIDDPMNMGWRSFNMQHIISSEHHLPCRQKDLFGGQNEWGRYGTLSQNFMQYRRFFADGELRQRSDGFGVPVC